MQDLCNIEATKQCVGVEIGWTSWFPNHLNMIGGGGFLVDLMERR